MRSKTIYSEQYVDCEYDVSFDDIMELIESCDDDELKIIRDLVGSSIKTNNLMDEQKLALLQIAFERYNLEQLQEKLDIKSYEY